MATAVLLAVVAAVCIGTADFFAGVVGRRDPSNSALSSAYAVVLLVSLPAAYLADGFPASAGIGWGAAMGVLWAIGIHALARGMAQGRVVVVVPIAGVLSAGIPVLLDIVSGGRPGPVVGLGVALGIVAVALVGVGSDTGLDRSVVWSATQGVIGGVATGLSLVLMDQAAESGLWPLVAAAFVAAIGVGAHALVREQSAIPVREALYPAAAMGLLVAAAFLAMMAAYPRGTLTTVSVVASQYPAVTIALVAVFWHQRPRGVQYLGVILTLVAVALIALG